jgi:hypothetical protein
VVVGAGTLNCYQQTDRNMNKIENDHASSAYSDLVVNVEVFDRGGLVGVDLWLYHHLENPNSIDSETVLVN